MIKDQDISLTWEEILWFEFDNWETLMMIKLMGRLPDSTINILKIGEYKYDAVAFDIFS